MSPPPQWVLTARACQLCIFGLTVSGVLSDSGWSRRRSLDVVEVWAGVASVAGSADEEGLRSKAFDIINNPQQDILSENGFKLALGWVLELRENGLLAMGPVCSSFVTLNCKNTKRTKSNVEGNSNCHEVLVGNMMAKAAAFLFLVAIARNVHAYIENPAGSMIFRYMREMGLLCATQFPFLASVVTHRCVWDTQTPYFNRYMKPYKFMATGSWITAVAQKCKCPTPQSGTKHLPLVKLSSNGGRTGLKEALKESQAYPAALGAALVMAWKDAQPATLEWLAETSLTSQDFFDSDGDETWPLEAGEEPTEHTEVEAWPHDEIREETMEETDAWGWPDLPNETKCVRKRKTQASKTCKGNVEEGAWGWPSEPKTKKKSAEPKSTNHKEGEAWPWYD